MTKKQHKLEKELDTPKVQSLEVEQRLASLVEKPDLTSPEMLASPSHESLYALWAVRLFTKPSYFRSINKRNLGFGGVDLQSFSALIGVEYERTADDEGWLPLPFFLEAQAVKEKLEPLSPGFNGLLKTNLQNLGRLIGLSEIDCQLLGFFCLLMSNKAFIEVTDELGEMNRQELHESLAIILDLPIRDIAAALSKNGKLFKTGLLKLDQRDNNDLQRKVDVLDGLRDVLMTESADPLELLAQYFYRSQNAEMSLAQFPHLEADTNALMAYLQAKRNQPGINILIHGEPGTGKTQWVKSLCQQLNQTLYEVSAEDFDGDPLPRDRRVAVYKLAQSALAHQGQSIVMFDEVEDVFPTSTPLFLNPRTSTGSKAWINKLLEENPVPSFWISNQIHHIDPAYIRRFDMVIEVPAPPSKVRKTMIEQALGDLKVSERWIEQLSKESKLVPAVIERAVKVAKVIQAEGRQPQEVESQVLGLINKTLKAQGKRAIKLKNTHSNLTYNLDYVNTDADLAKLVEGVKRSQAGRFCLYGLPGTGKTAFGHYLAESLEKPLIIKRASDLLSPYVGEAEMNIAAAFEEAVKEDAVLQIDEADSFLRSRTKARQSWEVTQVNELLTQMETFEGVFIASTNLMDDLDQAAMRRFDLKLEFKALTRHQAWLLFKNIMSEQGVRITNQAIIKQKLSTLSHLTPGDFAVVVRKLLLTGEEIKPGLVIAALQQELLHKPELSRVNGIGFLSSLH